MNITKQDYVIFICAVVIFYYFFFFVAPTPIYFQEGTGILPREATWDEKAEKYIIGFERSSLTIIAPVLSILWMFILINPDHPPLREIPIKAIIMHDIRNKIEEGKRITKEYFNRKR